VVTKQGATIVVMMTKVTILAEIAIVQNANLIKDPNGFKRELMNSFLLITFMWFSRYRVS
jgi:hypothetical protein